MKPRHAAALALVGWYLMMPMVQGKKLVGTASPPTGAETTGSDCGQLHYLTGDFRVDLDAPLSKWMIGHYSDSMQDCQAFLSTIRREEKGGSNAERGRNSKEFEVVEQTVLANAKCVAGDDPGLKENEEVREFQLMKVDRTSPEVVGCTGSYGKADKEPGNEKR